MSHAQRCPICNGTGQVEDERYINTTAVHKKTCHGCGGKGWVQVD